MAVPGALKNINADKKKPKTSYYSLGMICRDVSTMDKAIKNTFDEGYTI